LRLREDIPGGRTTKAYSDRPGKLHFLDVMARSGDRNGNDNRNGDRNGDRNGNDSGDRNGDRTEYPGFTGAGQLPIVKGFVCPPSYISVDYRVLHMKLQ
jgi:hypothetical protein